MAIAPGRWRNSSSSADDHSGRHSAGRPATVRHPAAGPRRLRSGRSSNRPGIVNAEYGPEAEQLVRERLEPGKHGRLLPALAQCWYCQLDQVRRPLEILTGQGVTDGIGGPTIRARTTRSRAGAEQATWSGCSAIKCKLRTSAKRW